MVAHHKYISNNCLLREWTDSASKEKTFDVCLTRNYCVALNSLRKNTRENCASCFPLMGLLCLSQAHSHQIIIIIPSSKYHALQGDLWMRHIIRSSARNDTSTYRLTVRVNNLAAKVVRTRKCVQKNIPYGQTQQQCQWILAISPLIQIARARMSRQ